MTVLMDNDLTNRKSKLSAAKQALLDKRLRGAGMEDSAWRKIQRRQPENSVPLSFAQQRLWLLDQLEPGSTAYNMSSAFRFAGPLDYGALGEALGTVVARHECLRTSFTIQGGRPVQVVAPALSLELPLTDLSSMAGTSRRNEVTRLATEEARRAFNLSQGPLFRVRLFRLGTEEHVLLWTVHHIISDAWSLDLFIRELATHYETHGRAGAAALPELPIQYADYSVWQRAWLESGVLERQLEYWHDRLASGPGALNLPTDRPRPQRLSFRGAHRSRSLPKRLGEQLQLLARQENATLFMVMLSAFNVLLYRYTGADDIVVGSPVAGRNLIETEALIGFFVNTLPLRSDLSGNPSFRGMMARTRESTLAAYANQDVPFEQLAQELRPPRGLGHSPFFQVMLDVHTGSESEQEYKGWSVENLDIDRGGARADLLLFVAEQANAVECWLEYSTDLFLPETIDRMLGHFQILLESIVEQPDRRISELTILAADERQELLATKNVDTAPPRDICLHQLFEEQVELTPTAVALVFGEIRLTYQELNHRANRLAVYLQQRGVGPEVLVGLCLERSVEMVVGLLAILKAGGAYLPLDPANPSERLAFILDDSQVSILLTQKSLIDKVCGSGAELISLDSDWEIISRAHGENPLSGSRRDNLAYVIYTSGSTGKPKGVLVTHHNVVRLFETTRSRFKFTADDVWTLFHSSAFDFSVWELWGALLYGGRLVVVPYLTSRSPEEFHEMLVAERVTVLNQTPSAFRQLQRADELSTRRDEVSLRLIIFGGEALDLKSLKPWFDRHGDSKPELVNMYGITETTVHVTCRALSRADLAESWRSPMGGALDDLRVYILDQNREPLPIGVPGEMYVGGEGLSRGYLNRPELTAERFVPHPFSNTPGARLYVTGDVARLLSNGDIEYQGRRDRQVKIRGFRIELGEIESVLRQHKDIRECLVVARDEENGDRQLTAYLLVKSGLDPTPDELRNFVRQRLPAQMVPSSFVLLASFPLTANGKIDLRALPLPETSRRDLAEAFVPPRTETEEMLAAMWGDVLGLQRVGVHDNFFDLGGHSLLATQIMSRVREAFNISLPLRCFFDKPTVAGLAEFVGDAIKENREAIPAIRRLPRS